MEQNDATDELIKMSETKGWALMMAQLRKEAEEARRSFVSIDIENNDEIKALQNMVYRYEWMDETLEILIQQGLQEENLDALQDEG